MIPQVRDAIIRLHSTHDWPVFELYMNTLRAEAANALTAIDPSDVVNISRIQGRVGAFDTVLDVTNEASRKLAEDKRTQ